MADGSHPSVESVVLDPVPGRRPAGFAVSPLRSAAAVMALVFAALVALALLGLVLLVAVPLGVIALLYVSVSRRLRGLWSFDGRRNVRVVARGPASGSSEFV